MNETAFLFLLVSKWKRSLHIRVMLSNAISLKNQNLECLTEKIFLSVFDAEHSYYSSVVLVDIRCFSLVIVKGKMYF